MKNASNQPMDSGPKWPDEGQLERPAVANGLSRREILKLGGVIVGIGSLFASREAIPRLASNLISHNPTADLSNERSKMNTVLSRESISATDQLRARAQFLSAARAQAKNSNSSIVNVVGGAKKYDQIAQETISIIPSVMRELDETASSSEVPNPADPAARPVRVLMLIRDCIDILELTEEKTGHSHEVENNIVEKAAINAYNSWDRCARINNAPSPNIDCIAQQLAIELVDVPKEQLEDEAKILLLRLGMNDVCEIAMESFMEVLNVEVKNSYKLFSQNRKRSTTNMIASQPNS